MILKGQEHQAKTDTGDTIGGKRLIGFYTPTINDNGDILFDGPFSGGRGIFTLTELLTANGDVINGKILTSFNSPTMNNNGDILFEGRFSGGTVMSASKIIKISPVALLNPNRTASPFPFPVC